MHSTNAWYLLTYLLTYCCFLQRLTLTGTKVKRRSLSFTAIKAKRRLSAICMKECRWHRMARVSTEYMHLWPMWVEGQEKVDLTDYVSSGTWDIIACPGNNTVDVGGDGFRHAWITFTLKIRRKTLFYTVNLIIPCVLISFLSVCVFYLPADAGEKMTMCISILLALVVFLLLVSKILPPTSINVPLIAKYLLFTFRLFWIRLVSSSSCRKNFFGAYFFFFWFSGQKFQPSDVVKRLFHLLWSKVSSTCMVCLIEYDTCCSRFLSKNSVLVSFVLISFTSCQNNLSQALSSCSFVFAKTSPTCYMGEMVQR